MPYTCPELANYLRDSSHRKYILIFSLACRFSWLIEENTALKILLGMPERAADGTAPQVTSHIRVQILANKLNIGPAY